MNAHPLIGVRELAVALAGPDAPVLLDASLILHRPEFDGDHHTDSGLDTYLAGHLPGAIHVRADEDFSVPADTHNRHPPPQGLADSAARFGIGPRTPTVVYDSTGGFWAARVWYLLRWIGVPVRVLDGGLAAWHAAGLAIDTGTAVLEPVPQWHAAAERDAWIDLDELREIHITNGNLVCALSAAAFSGAEPTRYSRRGHIPGSTNLPARALLDAHGLLRPPDEIAALYREAGVDLTREVLLYCGGGISATVNALALTVAGVDRIRIYDGSLEEWSADPRLPLTAG
ncbi:MAG: sulfurtransferase [Mycolicibacterium cosmeticum]|nr:sulfurtransferase [Mycolicibacterium cosmeticum]